jgi:hypothetical protein
MENNPIVLMVIGLVVVMAIMSFFPYVEGLLVKTGQSMATGGNYTVTTTSYDAVKSDLFAVGGPVLVLAFVAGLMAFMPRRQSQPMG